MCIIFITAHKYNNMIYLFIIINKINIYLFIIITIMNIYLFTYVSIATAPLSWVVLLLCVHVYMCVCVRCTCEK